MLRMKELRQAKGLKQEDLALIVGCSRENISRYEGGSRNPPIDVLRKLAAALGCTVDDLIALQDAVERDVMGGTLDDPVLKARYLKEPDEARAAIVKAKEQIR